MRLKPPARTMALREAPARMRLARARHSLAAEDAAVTHTFEEVGSRGGSVRSAGVPSTATAALSVSPRRTIINCTLNFSAVTAPNFPWTRCVSSLSTVLYRWGCVIHTRSGFEMCGKKKNAFKLMKTPNFPEIFDNFLRSDHVLPGNTSTWNIPPSNRGVPPLFQQEAVGATRGAPGPLWAYRWHRVEVAADR